MNLNLAECYTKETVTNEAKKILERLIEKEKIFITDYEKDQILMQVVMDVVKERNKLYVTE
ncbi:MAG: hypothetical protein WC996_08005 [Peptostreptococcales bacterium]